MGSPPGFGEVLDRWREKGILTPTQLEALPGELRPKAFWLAGVWESSFVEAIHGSIGKALESSTPYSEWLKEAQRILDGFGGTVAVYKGGDRWPPWYADLVFRNAVQAALAGGKYSVMFGEERVREAPFVIYRAVKDDRTRPEHRALDGRVFRKEGDAEARRYFPPWDHNCRCYLREVTLDELLDGGYRVTNGSDVQHLPVVQNGRVLGTVGRPGPGWDQDRVMALRSQALSFAGDG